MRLLFSAYACAPDKGSEPGAGWEFLAAAAQVATAVTVVTRRKNASAVTAATLTWTTPVQVVAFDLGTTTLRLKRVLPFGTQLYYCLWQARALRMVRGLHRLEPFDLSHHCTFASAWLPAFASRLGTPYVWGPVGGLVHMQSRDLRMLPLAGRLEELVRIGLAGLGYALWGRTLLRNAAVVLAQSETERELMGRPAKVIAHPNVIAEPPREAQVRMSGQSPRRAVIVARLIAWKGVHLAIAAMADQRASDWELHVLGDGPQMQRLRELCDALALSDRVHLHGYVSHSEVLAEVSRADALISASLHEAAGFAVAEAVAAGTPVIYVARGGPVTIVPEGRGIGVPVSQHIAEDIADALAGLGQRHEPSDVWSASRLTPLLREVYGRALAGSHDDRLGAGRKP